MKICFIANNNVGDSISGGDRIFIEFLKNWRDDSELVLLGLEEAIKIAKYRGVLGVKFIQSDVKNIRFDSRIFSIFKHIFRRTLRGILAIKKNISEFDNADFVYSISDFYPDFIPTFYLKLKRKRIKWIAGYYLFAANPFSKESPYKGEAFFKGLLYWLMQRPSYFIINRFADFVFVTSQPDVHNFISKKRDRSKIIVVQGGVDITESEKYLNSGNVIPVKNRKHDACFAGRFHYQKGVLILVDIWKKVCEKKKDAKLVMIGIESLEDKLKKKIIILGLENNIELLGFRDGNEKYEIFKQSKMMLHPATYDSGGMAAAEGMAWELPGVSFDLEALKTYYPKGMIKAEIGNIKKFAENILELLNNENLFKKTSNDAYSLIIETWNWEKRLRLIYNKLFSSKR